MEKKEELNKEKAFENREIGAWQMVGEIVFFFATFALIVLGCSVM